MQRDIFSPKKKLKILLLDTTHRKMALTLKQLYTGSDHYNYHFYGFYADLDLYDYGTHLQITDHYDGSVICIVPEGDDWLWVPVIEI